jgi:hypothetical protein
MKIYSLLPSGSAKAFSMVNSIYLRSLFTKPINCSTSWSSCPGTKEISTLAKSRYFLRNLILTFFQVSGVSVKLYIKYTMPKK